MCVCLSTIQQGLKGGDACLHVTLAFLERLYDEEARVEEAVDAVGLRAGGPVSELRLGGVQTKAHEARLLASAEASAGSALDAAVMRAAGQSGAGPRR